MGKSSKVLELDIVDLYVHVFPEIPWPNKLVSFKEKLTDLLRPVSRFQHEAQPQFRHLSEAVRRWTDELAIPLALPHLILESNIFDLDLEMKRNNVKTAFIVPFPPLSSNDFVFYESKRVENAMAVTVIDPHTMKSVEDLKAFHKRGVRVFSVDPSQNGIPLVAPFYRPFLSFLNAQKLPLIIKTGTLSSHLLKLPSSGEISEYENWISTYQDIPFLAAHMNYHAPQKAIDLAKKYDNLFLLTSWQSTESLRMAIEKIGAERLCFASHWPLLGENIFVQKKRWAQLYENRVLTIDDVESVFYKNAQRLINPTPSEAPIDRNL